MPTLAGVDTRDELSMVADIVCEDIRTESGNKQRESSIYKKSVNGRFLYHKSPRFASLYATSSALLSNGTFQDILF